MSTITTDDVHHLAQLSSLQLSDSEVENLRTDLENIINYIKQLNEVDAGSVTPEQLLDLAAEQSGHCVKVPKVL